MYTLLIVDDEPLIRNGVKKIIDWESLGFSNILLAEDGQEAIDIIRENRVDLVLTDIMMPFIDGIELSRMITTEFPQIHIVILTGYEDFEYAQKSVELGVKNYILKPVGAETLYKQMKGICERLHIENKEKQYISSMKIQLNQSLPALRNQMLDRIVCNSGTDIQQYLDRCGRLDIHLEKGPFEIGLMDIDLSEQPVKDHDLYLFAVRNIVKECVGEKHYVFEDGRDRVAVLFCCVYLGEEEDYHENVYQMMEVLQKAVYQNIQIKTTCSTGKLVEMADNINDSYIGAKKALECKYSLGDDNVYDIRDLDYLEKAYYYPNREIKELITSVRIGDGKQIAEAVHKIICFVGQGKPLSGINTQMNYISSVTALLREVSEMKNPSEEIWNEGMVLFKSIDRLKTPQELERSLYQFSCKISNQLRMTQKNSGQQIIDKVQEFIEQNYKNQDLSLVMASEYVSVSTGYLSGLFKKETGTNFIKYLTDLRMKKGEELLLHTDMKTYEIAYETGFANPHYFSIAFKKYTGMSPSEYRTRE